MKTCKQCKQQKEESEFYVDKKSKDGRTSKCKSCILSHVKTRIENETTSEREHRLEVSKLYNRRRS